MSFIWRWMQQTRQEFEFWSLIPLFMPITVMILTCPFGHFVIFFWNVEFSLKPIVLRFYSYCTIAEKNMPKPYSIILLSEVLFPPQALQVLISFITLIYGVLNARNLLTRKKITWKNAHQNLIFLSYIFQNNFVCLFFCSVFNLWHNFQSGQP